MVNSLKDQIYGCRCSTCRAVVWLVDDRGAHLQFSATRAGRLCELAVVAAAGDDGLDESEVVSARRSYASHLGVKLTGPISNSDQPIHILHAIDHSNHNPNASNRINLGQAYASFRDGRFTLL